MNAIVLFLAIASPAEAKSYANAKAAYALAESVKQCQVVEKADRPCPRGVPSCNCGCASGETCTCLAQKATTQASNAASNSCSNGSCSTPTVTYGAPVYTVPQTYSQPQVIYSSPVQSFESGPVYYQNGRRGGFFRSSRSFGSRGSCAGGG